MSPPHVTGLLICLAAPLLAFQGRPFNATVDVVQVAAVVVNERGDTVRGLRSGDFEIREDGRQEPITAFAVIDADDEGPGAEPVNGRFIVLLLDNILTSPARTEIVKRIATMFAQRMGPRDVLAVLPLDGGTAVTSADRKEVLKTIRRFRPSISATTTRPQVMAIKGIDETVRQLASVKHRRKVVAFIGSGDTFEPTEPVGRSGERAYAPEWFDALRDIAEANVSLYVVDPAGLTGRQYDGALAFAEDTGGQAFINSNVFETSVGRIWNEAGEYYLLGYTPPAHSSKRLHRIDVSVKRDDVHVRARRTRR